MKIQQGGFWLVVLALILTVVFLLVYQVTTSASAPVVINQTAVPPLPTLDSEKVVQGEILYAQYCAKCHGAKLEGAADWKRRLPDGSLPAPPHDSSGHTWHHSDELLISITEDGGNLADNSKMPPFREQLTREEIAAILEFMKGKWGIEEREYQWWMTSSPKP